MSRWIKLYDSIRGNWIWKNPRALKWWLDILMMAEYEKKTVKINNAMVLLERGQLIASISYLRERWEYTNDKGHKCIPSPPTISNFLRLLEKDNMIIRDTKKLPNRITLITICNYDKYQQVYRNTKADQNNTVNNTTNNAINKENINKKEDDKSSSKKGQLELFAEAKPCPKGYEKFDFSIIADEYMKAVIMWLDYKKSRREMYKSQESFEQLYRKMLKIGSSEDIMEAVENSIANNYAGLFSGKNKRIGYGDCKQTKQQEKEQRRNDTADIIKRLIEERRDNSY